MKKSYLLLIFAVILLGSATAKDFMSTGTALKEVMSGQDSLFKEEIALTRDQANDFNRRYDSDYRRNEKFTVYYTKDSSGSITSYGIVLEDILWKYVASHEWALGYNSDGTLRGVRIISLTDEYSFPLADPRFLNQFDNLSPASIDMPGNVDAVTGATMSSELLVETSRKAWEIIQLLD